MKESDYEEAILSEVIVNIPDYDIFVIDFDAPYPKYESFRPCLVEDLNSLKGIHVESEIRDGYNYIFKYDDPSQLKFYKKKLPLEIFNKQDLENLSDQLYHLFISKPIKESWTNYLELDCSDFVEMAEKIHLHLKEKYETRK